MTRGLAGLLIATACVVGLAVISVAAILISLPDVHALKGCITTELYHVNLCKNSPNYSPYDQISHHIIDAVIMSEDASFYSHQGIDLVEMKESLKKDMNELRFARGASTITQQMVKNVFLSNQKSLIRKGEEIYLALQVEKVFTKAQILTFYLNVVEFGHDIYGVKQASQYYFKRLPSEVTPEQAAFLAFLLPNPKKYSQSFKKGDLTPFASKMVKTILNRMAKSHRLSGVEYEEALSRVGSHLWSGDTPIQANTDTESPMGVVEQPDSNEPETNQEGDDFKFDFNADEQQ